MAPIRLVGKMAHNDFVCRHQFPPAIIRHAVWLYVRFTFSYCDVEDLLPARA
jgi:transposase-like protein